MADTPTIRFRPRPAQGKSGSHRQRNAAGDGLRPVITRTRQMPAAFTPPRDELDDEIDAALAEGRRVDLAAAFPEPPQPAPAGPDPVLTPIPYAHPGATNQHYAGYAVTPGSPPPAAPAAPPPPIATVAPPAPPPPPPLPAEDNDPIPGASPEQMTPAQRIRHVGVIAPTYLDEYRARLLHRLLMRRLPLDVIAAQLQISVRAVQIMKQKLRKRLAAQALSLNVYDIAGETIAFYNEVRGIAMKQVDNSNLNIKDRQYAMRIAMEAQNDIIRFLSSSGYFEATPYVVERGKADDPKQGEVDQTLAMLAAVMNPDSDETSIASFFEGEAIGDGLDHDGMDPNTDVL